MKVIMSDSYKDRIPGGKADECKPSDFNKEQLDKGIKIEYEHTNDMKKAREIAMDHLKENSRYYDHLQDMEKKFE